MPKHCTNHELCEGESIEGISEFCMSCGSWFKVAGFGWNKLTFVDCDEECLICSEHCNKKLMFPTNCGHSFCIPCCKNLLFGKHGMYDLSYQPYGCPPCPNGCKNPIKGPQCGCEEYDPIIDNWQFTKPAQFKRWSDAQDLSYQTGDNSSYGKSTCPLCRKKYERAFS